MIIFITSKITGLIASLIRLLKLGNGYTLPGYLILKIFPNILESKRFKYKKGIVLISGTNGKTTTAKLITDIFRGNGIKVVNNSSGSNLLRGIVTSLVLDLNFWGKPSADVAVLEVDEFALSRVLTYLEPNVLVLLNLSRDQLDRYGETDTILLKWVHSLENLSKKTTLVIDSTQPILNILKDVFRGETAPFNAFAPKGVLVEESFNIKNINAALKVSSLYKISLNKALEVINNFEYAYGRGETIEYKGNKFRVYLAKNPASFNSNIEMLMGLSTFDSLLFILNDNIPDGRDVSWIYDIERDSLKNFYKKSHIRPENIYISGTRCYDMAVRLQYAGMEILPSNVNTSVQGILDTIFEKKDMSFVVLPNYSSMLEFRKLTLGKNIL